MQPKALKVEHAMTNDPYNLDRFVTAQNREGIYETALRELRNGRKESDFMWFVFPQMRGLGTGETALHYGIGSWDEAAAYLEHDVLGQRLRRCAEVVARSPVKDPNLYMGKEIDVLKLKSSMTLFDAVSDDSRVFAEVLRNYFHGGRDLKTLELLKLTEAASAAEPSAAPPRQRTFWRRILGRG